MNKNIPAILLFIFSLPFFGYSQECAITQVTATQLPCNEYSFMVSVNLSVSNPSSQGFTLAGNGVIYGTWLYSDLPVTVGPLLGDDLSHYEFIAWDVQNPACQNFVTFDAADCGPIPHFWDFTMDSIYRVTSKIAAVLIDFKHENEASTTYDLYYGSGALATTQLYATLPFFITNFTTNGAGPITVKVCDHNHLASCQTFVVDAIDCSPNNCEIYNVKVDPECLGGNFVVHLDFDIDHPASDSFNVHGNSLNYGKFAYADLPVVIGPLNGNSSLNWDFIIQDNKTPSCSADGLLGVYHCPPPCNILDFEAMAVECNGDDAYQLRLDMEIEGKGDAGYSIFSENYFYGTHAYKDLPYTVPNFAVGNYVDQVTVCDNENPGCCATKPFAALLCNGCIIYNLVANPLPCDDQGQFFISIDFDFQNVSSDGFSITGTQMNYGEFSYSQVPVLLGPFDGNGQQVFEFVVTDLLNEDCFDATEIGTLPCSSICELSGLTADPAECTGNSTYILHVNFDHSGTLGDGFDLYANGEYYNTYNYSALPLTILEFPSSGDGTDMIQVCDTQNSNCCTSIDFDSPDCQCSIFDVSAETLGCTSDTTFAISVEFFSNNLIDNAVDVSVDGIFLGTYDVASIPFTVPNVPEGTGTSILTICGHAETDCCVDQPIQLINCEGPQCSIWDLNAVVGACSSDIAYHLDIFFNHANLPVDSVNISANGQDFGKFKIQPDFIRILNFPQTDDIITTLTVCAIGNSNCCDSYSYTTPDCTPDACEVSGLVAFPGACTSDTTYEVVIEYLTENFTNDSVTVTANGNLLDTVFDPDHHIYIQFFPVYPTDQTVITVCSYISPDCCDTYSFATPSCLGEGPCHLHDLTAEAGNCQQDSTYLLALNFNFDHLTIDSVIITANGNDMGTFQVQEGHIVFDHFPVFPSATTSIQVCGAGNPDCCDEVSFDTPHCSGPTDCNISNLQIHVGDCISDTTYILFVDFQSHDLPVDSVVITTDEGYAAHFAVNNGHIVIDSFQSTPSHPTIMSVCAVGSPDCCAQEDFVTPDCTGGGSCHLYELNAIPGECTSDLTYSIDIHFWWNNLPTDSVLIYANNFFIGTFHTNPDLIHIENFPIVGGANTTLQVCALGAPDCCAEYSFSAPDCSVNNCSIFDISVQTFDCNSDSTFGAIINFQYQNVSATGFDVYTGDQYLGFYTLEQVPIIANQFPSNASGEYVITICEDENSNCCSSFEFEGPVCAEGACDIFDLQYSLTDCDSAGNFFFILNFQHNNVGASGFNVVGNGNIYGNFSYDQLPVQIGPFPSDNTLYEFLVTDAENAACFDFIEPGAVVCEVATTTPVRDDIFRIYNNGSDPSILAVKDVNLSLFNSNGKLIAHHKLINAGTLFNLNGLPGGFYIANIVYNNNSWPVKLVKASN